MKLILAQIRGLPFFSLVLHLRGHIFSAKYPYLACKNWMAGDHRRSIVRWFRAGEQGTAAEHAAADPSLSARTTWRRHRRCADRPATSPWKACMAA